ncbi:uncharacterized protein LOC131069358 [Cryptomeria japonica]|uniref:uncharacterized protein LOC131069358 n=1 Tax=Cryptomeria japonica TaxID=3369 RepID=UPI0027D9E985|nr:uncharacterized protein LOC131069358 [Cryptomeria japonica]
MDQTKDTEAKDKILDAQIFEVEDLDSDILNTMDSHEVTVAMMPPSKDMVFKYIEKGTKPKKFKTTTRLDNDEGTRKWVAKIASYKPKDKDKEVGAEDFEITKVELGNMSRDSDNHFFQVSAKKMLARSEKDGREKRKLKRHINILTQFITEFDGSCANSGSEAGVVLLSPNGNIFPFSFKLDFKNTNLTAKYEALLLGLNEAKCKGIKLLKVKGDAEMIVRHVRNVYSVKNDRLKHYRNKVWDEI